MLRKLCILATTYLVLLLVDGCRQCPDILPYYDYHSILLHYPDGTSMGVNQSFRMVVGYDDMEYLSMQSPGLLHHALATQPCPENGEVGPKYEITKVEITSNAPWDDEHPAGASLLDVIRVAHYERATLVYQTLLSDPQGLTYANMYGLQLRIYSPTTSQVHQFTISVTKSNGEQLSAESTTIAWE